tara:strand:- start:61 stop:360 length:300 start_codon:yes stop_codon:yes gene_type:complete
MLKMIPPELLLFNGNTWLVIGLVLCILELSSGNLVFFLPMGVSGLLVGIFLKVQESYSFSFIDDWAWAATIWAILALALSLILNKIMKPDDNNKDINQY